MRAPTRLRRVRSSSERQKSRAKRVRETDEMTILARRVASESACNRHYEKSAIDQTRKHRRTREITSRQSTRSTERRRARHRVLIDGFQIGRQNHKGLRPTHFAFGSGFGCVREKQTQHKQNGQTINITSSTTIKKQRRRSYRSGLDGRRRRRRDWRRRRRRRTAS